MRGSSAEQRAAGGRGGKDGMRRELDKVYDPSGIEDRIYRNWEEKKYFHAVVDHSKQPFTIVIPPPNITRL